ncbi:transglycosylase domain-containing protein, partial [Candidatus Microgenomates bacterium]|nr:transglycosylase domain-containing protein [Candidatus Microgenomates bacterium]
MRFARRMRSRSRIFLLSRFSTFIFFGIVILLLSTIILFAWYGRDLPKPGKLSSSNLTQSTRIFDRNQILLYSVYSSENRIYVSLSDIPKSLQEATIAIEDKNFYKNEGYSLSGYLRAVRDMILVRKITGGSTITQQLIKNTLLTSERTIPRKIKEFILAVQVDRKYNKDEILELYLNAVS